MLWLFVLCQSDQLAIFIGYAIVQKGKGIPTTMTSGAPLESPLVYNPYRRYEAWRFLSYMFIHDGCVFFSFRLFTLIICKLNFTKQLQEQDSNTDTDTSTKLQAYNPSSELTVLHKMLFRILSACNENLECVYIALPIGI